MLFNFVWEKSYTLPETISHMNSYENGGLNLLDFTTLNHTFKISWIKPHPKIPDLCGISFLITFFLILVVLTLVFFAIIMLTKF